MRSIAALSGWGQPHDALAAAVPKARFIDYSAYETIDEVFDSLRTEAGEAETLIGWSLGGQLIARAVAEKIISPRALILIATPFQFVAGDESPLGMGRITFTQFRENFARDPKRTLKKSYALISHKDENSDTVSGYIDKQNNIPDFTRWSRWLDILSAYSCDELDFSHFPSTLLIHGENDAVVSPAQSQEFQRRLPLSQALFLKGCGHAPHWHDAAAVRARIAEFLA